MEKRNLSFIEKLDAVVLFTLAATGIAFLLMNGFADLFIKLGVRQLWEQRILILAPFVVAAMLLVLRECRKRHQNPS